MFQRFWYVSFGANTYSCLYETATLLGPRVAAKNVPIQTALECQIPHSLAIALYHFVFLIFCFILAILMAVSWYLTVVLICTCLMINDQHLVPFHIHFSHWDIPYYGACAWPFAIILFASLYFSY